MICPGNKRKTVVCVGAGYVGGPTSVILALKAPDVDVHVLDKSVARVEAWNSDRLPISEPGLGDALRAIKGRPRPNLVFSTDVDGLLPKADIVFIAVETPPGLSHGSTARSGVAPDLGTFHAAVQQVASLVTKDVIIVNKSTVPCGTADETARMVRSRLRPGIRCEVLSNPEFLAEGTAVENLLNPDRVVIGSSQSPNGLAAATVLADLYALWVPRERIVTLSTRSSELAKLAANMLLSQRISSVNALSAVCEKLGADVTEVSRACALDRRIGPHMLRASVGFGGSCFKKDVLHLAHAAHVLSLDEVAAYFTGIVSLNSYQTERYAKALVEHEPRIECVAVLGFAFKPDTGDTRESPAIAFIRALIINGISVRVYDPLVPKPRIIDAIRASLRGLTFLADSHLTVSDG
ncbi:UDP-glucose 6-dehydrogenase [Colletotrichum trifolii]|uniref:UDP-glucose 6-dehydrogenase n=1 Tax=Colletotrichum trifolii TaxID=5466 RepID=A0A4R8RE89_COLTR|nr:UDP-glucose 6-dehydrogenase [Colletotrichum trifolii]